MTTHHLTFRGNTIEYLAAGTGPALMLLHGAGASAAANWSATIDLLAPTHRVLAVNLPGAGHTTWSAAEVTFTDLTDLVLALADAEGLATFGLVGYSTGAMLAMQVAGTAPGRVSLLVAIAPWLTNDARTTYFFRFWGDLLQTDAQLFARYNTLTALSQTAHTYMNEEAFAGTTAAFANTGFNADLPKLLRMNEHVSVEPALGRITAATQVVAFADDRICPPHYARTVTERIAGAALVEIPAGHGGPWEATEAMNAVITQFLALSGANRS